MRQLTPPQPHHEEDSEASDSGAASPMATQTGGLAAAGGCAGLSSTRSSAAGSGNARRSQNLIFSGSGTPSSSLPGASSGCGGGLSLSWRDGRFSDWSVQVGDKTYNLHAFLLARSSSFFEKHMSLATSREAEGGPLARRCSDLTEVLPRSCHTAFEDALDFVYSENQAAFEVHPSKALLLLKLSDILQIEGLATTMSRHINTAFAETAPLLLEQYCKFHIPGTDDGQALGEIRAGAVELIIAKFQPFLAAKEMKEALLRLPASMLVEILMSDTLLVANEDVVYDFVAARLSNPDRGSEGEEEESCSESVMNAADKASQAAEEAAMLLWPCVRWQHLSAGKFAQAVSPGKRLMNDQLTLNALLERTKRLDLGGMEALSYLTGPSSSIMTDLGHSVLSLPRQAAVLPPGVPPPTSTEIDFCFHYPSVMHFQSGEPLRSQPKRIGDAVLGILVFPAGTNTGVARGSLSIFLEAIPQAHWHSDWEFASIKYAISCIRWPTSSNESWSVKKKNDVWTFKVNRHDRGWHDFLEPSEVKKFIGPDGFICVRGSLEQECLSRCFLQCSQTQNSSFSGSNSEPAACSTAQRRSGVWMPSSTPPPPVPAATTTATTTTTSNNSTTVSATPPAPTVAAAAAAAAVSAMPITSQTGGQSEAPRFHMA